jgi:hypothetical protein
MFVIEDERHAKWHGEFHSLEDALTELKRRSHISWDTQPNVAPCSNWKNCGRKYEVVEYDDATRPWKEIRRLCVLEISAAGVVWSDEFKTLGKPMAQQKYDPAA